MRRLSVKARLMVLITVLLLVLSSAVLVILVNVTSTVVQENAQEQLEATLRANLSEISRTDSGTLHLGDGFVFSRNGAYTLIYSSAGALLAGQPPLDAPEGPSFENGILREDGPYYILDFWLPFGWDDGVWVRGLMQSPEVADAAEDLMAIAMLLLAGLVVVGGAAAYLLVQAAFRPIGRIAATAEAIGEGRDLSRRIGLPPGRDEVSRLASSFDSMFQRLEASFEAEKQFTSDASHELRTPTAVILAQCGETRHAETPEQYRQAIAVIERQARKMSDLIGQLLQMTRLDQGTLRASMEEADLTELVEVLCAEQPDRGVTIAVDASPDIRAVFDVTLMTRLLQNLLDNAVRYGRQDGHVWVTLRRDGGSVTLAVRDDGIGIPADRLEKIWQRFYQVDPSRSGSAGTGLGLTMVRQIAELHGGSVTVESREGRGSCFTLRFPACPKPS